MSFEPSPRPGLATVIARLAWCLVGVAAGIAVVLLVVSPPHSPFLLASLGGTTLFLFGLTRADAAQPRALIGGHAGGALIGIFCYQLFGDALWVYGAAEVIAVAYMLTTRTVHPPAGANPIIMIQCHAGWSALLQPVLAGALCLIAVAAIWSRLYKGMQKYPRAWLAPSPPTVNWGAWSD